MDKYKGSFADAYRLVCLRRKEVALGKSKGSFATKMKVREIFPNPKFSGLTKTCVKAGEALEAIGCELFWEHYAQGEQLMRFLKDGYTLDLTISEDDR